MLTDAWYTCRRVWRVARARGFAVTAGLKCNRKLRVRDEQGQRAYLSLSDYVAGLADSAYQQVDWPHEDGGARAVYAHLINTWVKRLGPCQVLVVRERLGQPLKGARFWATSERQADVATVVGWAARRWAIEGFFADIKEECGSDHYQLRSATGLLRFWHLGFLAYTYLEGQRATLLASGDSPGLTIGQVRWRQQQAHRSLLLDWIYAHFANGFTREQVEQLLAA